MTASSAADRFRTLAANALEAGISRHMVAAVIPYQGTVLLVRRPLTNVRAGLWELPRGEVAGDESLEQALSRVVGATTGLTVSAVGLAMGHFDYVSADGRRTRQFNFLTKVADVGHVNLGANTLHTSFVWASADDYERYLTRDETTHALQRFWMGRGIAQN